MSICLFVIPVQGSCKTLDPLSLLSFEYLGLNFIPLVKTDVGFKNEFQEFLFLSPVNFSPWIIYLFYYKPKVYIFC